MKTLVPIYHAVMLEIERRRQAAGISMDEMSELMGTAERAYSKMLYCETPSGRVAGWDTVQKAVDVLFCDGFELRIHRANTGPLTSEGTRRKIKQSAILYDRKALSERMTELGRKGGQIGGVRRWDGLSKRTRSRMAKRAALKRWKTPVVTEITKDANGDEECKN